MALRQCLRWIHALCQLGQGEAEGGLKGNVVINYTEMDAPYTRVHDHQHFVPCKTHCIVSGCGGNPDIVDDQVNGILILQPNAQLLAEKLSHFCRVRRRYNPSQNRPSKKFVPRSTGPKWLAQLPKIWVDLAEFRNRSGKVQSREISERGLSHTAVPFPSRNSGDTNCI